jgi:hypothetical protein
MNPMFVGSSVFVIPDIPSMLKVMCAFLPWLIFSTDIILEDRTRVDMFCSPSGYPFEKFDELEKPGDEPKKES